MQYNTDHKIQFMTSIKLLHVSAPKCHPEGIYINKGMHIKHVIPGADQQCLHWRGGFVLLYTIRLPEDGILLLKHAAV
jgi:hypothetical protein